MGHGWPRSLNLVSSHETRFPTVRIPSLPGLDAYVQLMTGWNLLVEIACALGVDMDRPARARKIGNLLECA